MTKSYQIEVTDDDRDLVYSFPELVSETESDGETVSGNTVSGNSSEKSGSSSSNADTVSGNQSDVSGNGI